MNWLLPHGSSTFVGDIDWIYYVILIVTGIAFVVVEVVLLWFLVRYRDRPGAKARYLHGSNRAEIIWTSVTAVVVVVIGLMSAGPWDRIKGRDSVPPGALEYGLLAKQFEWHVTYAGRDARLGNGDDFTVRSQLHIPVDTPIVLTMQSEDVIHSFFVPEFRIKQDAVPGMQIRVWFKPTEVGTYELGCAELCGLGHYRMRAVVTVHSREDYDRWLAERASTVALQQQ
jgi:cytochrome c oxidase subunit 2